MATDYDYIIRKGNLGVGTRNPQAKLHVSGSISGSSINFGQTVLNFYEESSWTPEINTTGNDVSGVNYLEPTNGTYTRIGNVVHAWFEINVEEISNAGSGTAIIEGLPYSANTNLTVFSAVTITEGDILVAGSSGDQDPIYDFDNLEEAEIKAAELQAADPTGRQYRVEQIG
jgi:hypothetical protein